MSKYIVKSGNDTYKPMNSTEYIPTYLTPVSYYKMNNLPDIAMGIDLNCRLLGTDNCKIEIIGKFPSTSSNTRVIIGNKYYNETTPKQFEINAKGSAGNYYFVIKETTNYISGVTTKNKIGVTKHDSFYWTYYVGNTSKNITYNGLAPSHNLWLLSQPNGTNSAYEFECESAYISITTPSTETTITLDLIPVIFNQEHAAISARTDTSVTYKKDVPCFYDKISKKIYCDQTVFNESTRVFNSGRVTIGDEIIKGDITING